MIASTMNRLALMPPSTPSRSVALWPMVKQRLPAYCTTSLKAEQEEDDADQKQQVIVTGHHVLGAEVHQRHDRLAAQPLEVNGVLARDAVGFEALGGDERGERW